MQNESSSKCRHATENTSHMSKKLIIQGDLLLVSMSAYAVDSLDFSFGFAICM